VSDLAAACLRVGVPERDFLSVIQDLGRRELCRSVDGLAIQSDSAVVPTRLAAYAIKQMCHEFAYVDLCSVDAAILDPDALHELQETTVEIEATQAPPERVALRGRRIEQFLDYLVRCEERWVVECKRRELPAEWLQQLVKDELRPAILRDAESALHSAERRYKRQTEAAAKAREKSGAKPATAQGRISGSWSQKEYVFIRDDKGTDWFSHKRDFLSANDWNIRGINARCTFVPGEWQGKPRATSVHVHHGRQTARGN